MDLNFWKEIIYPFGVVDKKTKSVILTIQLVLLVVFLQFFHGALIPAPLDILNILVGFISSQSFLDDFLATFMFVMKGMFYAMVITMVLTYAHPIVFFAPFVEFITKCRYLTFSTVLIMFTMFIQGGNLSDLKMILLLFGTVPFFVNSFVEETAIGQGTPQYHLNKAYVNKLNKWESLWQVIMVGKLDRLFVVVKQNFAIAWAVVTTVEANAMNDGGIGTIISKSNKHMLIGELIAIAIIVLVIGVLFDYLYGLLRYALFSYTRNIKK